MRGPPRAPQQCQRLRFFPVSELGMRWLEWWGHGDEAPTCPQLEDGRERGGGRTPASPTGPGSCTGWMLSPSFLSPNSLVLSVGYPLLSTLYPSLLPPSRLPQHRGWVGWGALGFPPQLSPLISPAIRARTLTQHLRSGTKMRPTKQPPSNKEDFSSAEHKHFRSPTFPPPHSAGLRRLHPHLHRRGPPKPPKPILRIAGTVLGPDLRPAGISRARGRLQHPPGTSKAGASLAASQKPPG